MEANSMKASGGSLQSQVNNLTNLDVSDKSIADTLEKVFDPNNKNTSSELQQLATTKLQQRQQSISMFSNIMRMLADGANAIIRNIRA